MLKHPLSRLAATAALALGVVQLAMTPAQAQTRRDMLAQAEASPIRSEFQRNGVTVRILRSDCADGKSPLQIVTTDPSSLPADHLVGNTLANTMGRIGSQCGRALTVFEAPLVTPDGKQIGDGYLYAKLVGWSIYFNREKLTSHMEKWFREDPSARAQFIYILSGHFEDNPINVTGNSPMAQIIYAFSKKDAANCPAIVGSTAEMAWRTYTRRGSFQDWNSGRFKVDAGLASVITSIFYEGNTPGYKVSNFADQIFQVYDCDSVEIERMRMAVAQQAVRMYGGEYTSDTPVAAAPKADTRALKPTSDTRAFKPGAKEKIANRAFKWAPAMETIRFTSGGKEYTGEDVERLVENTLIDASWNARREYGQVPKKPMFYSHWVIFQDDSSAVYVAGVDRQTDTVDVRKIDISKLKASQEAYHKLPDEEAKKAFMFAIEPDLEYYTTLKESFQGTENDVFSYRAFDVKEGFDFHVRDKSYAAMVDELKQGAR